MCHSRSSAQGAARKGGSTLWDSLLGWTRRGSSGSSSGNSKKAAAGRGDEEQCELEELHGALIAPNGMVLAGGGVAEREEKLVGHECS